MNILNVYSNNKNNQYLKELKKKKKKNFRQKYCILSVLSFYSAQKKGFYLVKSKPS